MAVHAGMSPAFFVNRGPDIRPPELKDTAVNRLINGILHDYPIPVLAMDSAPAPAPTPDAAIDEDDMRITLDSDGEMSLIFLRKTK